MVNNSTALDTSGNFFYIIEVAQASNVMTIR